MRNTNQKYGSYKATFVGFALLAFLFTGCADKMNNQAVNDSAVIEDPVVDADNSVTEDNAVANTGITKRYTYVQPMNRNRDDYKVLIDASKTSFKALDDDKDGIVEKDEFFTGLYELMDVDDNALLDEKELVGEVGFFDINKNSELYTFADWGATNTRGLTMEEFREKLTSVIDIADEKKLAQDLYIVWDTDDDAKVEQLELENVVIRFDQDTN